MSTPQQSLQLLTKPGSSLYYSCLFLTTEQRTRLAPLVNFCWKLERIPRFSHHTEVVIKQLNWWQQEIAQAFIKEASHPLSIELSAISFSDLKRGKQPSQREPPRQTLATSLINAIEYLLQLQIDCQIDDHSAFEHHALQKRAILIQQAATLIGVKQLADDILLTASKLLTSLDMVDGFHRDAALGIITFPLEQIINAHLTIDKLASNNNNHAFWMTWAKQSSELYEQLWHQSKAKHPLILTILIYSGIRLLAFNNTLNKTPSKTNSCYNLRPTIGPLKKFWLSWRIRSRWLSGKAPVRILKP